jgi:hypothetical protein
MKLEINILNKAIGKRVKSVSGELLGEMAEMMQSDKKDGSGYIVLKSNILFGRGERFFAIPVLASLVNVASDGKISLKLEKDDLQFAPGIAVEKCPQPPPQFNPSIYELYKYRINAAKIKHSLNTNNK